MRRLVATALAASGAAGDAATVGPLRAPALLSKAVLLLRLSSGGRRRRREGGPRRALYHIARAGTRRATTIVKKLETVYLGGGTPSLVEPRFIKNCSMRSCEARHFSYAGNHIRVRPGHF